MTRTIELPTTAFRAWLLPCLLFVASLAAGSPASAAAADAIEPSGFHYYLQGSLGASRQTSPGNGGQLDLSGHGQALAYDLGAGVQFTPRWGAEIHYVGLGRVSIATPSGTDRYDMQLISLVGTVSQPLTERWTMFGRLGLAWTHASSDIDAIGYHSTSRKTPLVAGLGMKYALSPSLALVGHYDYYGHTGRYAGGDPISASALGVGLQWSMR